MKACVSHKGSNPVNSSNCFMHHQFEHSKILPYDHTVYCVLFESQNKDDTSLYSINFLVIITEVECVYCAVRDKSLG